MRLGEIWGVLCLPLNFFLFQYSHRALRQLYTQLRVFEMDLRLKVVGEIFDRKNLFTLAEKTLIHLT